MARSPSRHSIESPERLDFNEDDDDLNLLGDPGTSGKKISLTQEEEAELLGSTDDEADTESPMIISQEDPNAVVLTINAEADEGVSNQQQQQKQQPVAVPEPPSDASPPAVAAELPEEDCNNSSIASSPLSTSSDISPAPASSNDEAANSAAGEGLATTEPNLTASPKTAPNSDALLSTEAAPSDAVGSSADEATAGQPGSVQPQRRERKRLLPPSSSGGVGDGRSPRHSFPLADPNTVFIDLTGESSNDDDEGEADNSSGSKAETNKTVSDNNNNNRGSAEVQQKQQQIPSTSGSVTQASADLRQIINKQRQLKRRQAEILHGPRRHSMTSSAPAAATAAPAGRGAGGAVFSSGAACRFQCPPWKQVQQQQKNAFIVRPHGGAMLPQQQHRPPWRQPYHPQQQQPPQMRQLHPQHSQQQQPPQMRQLHPQHPQQHHQHHQQQQPLSIGQVGSAIANRHYYNYDSGADADDELPWGRPAPQPIAATAIEPVNSLLAFRPQQQPQHRVADRRWCSGAGANYAAAEAMRHHLAADVPAVASAAAVAAPTSSSFERTGQGPTLPFNIGYPSSSGRTSVRIENCPDGITEQDLATLTDPLGPVCEYRLVPSTYKAFVKFYNEQQAAEFVKRYNRKPYKGLPLYMALTQ
ncbi:hypothetical protein BOX15_Mlig010905g2 [Macrostomum lignano]|uniref:RRM domain-containing protein n=2 Tax=Macrostomum lignano TaxID=282301 RepID=A0A267DSZ3_9PLAT|nr:hypothetical protein BOX15_Mlig010905g2 [Macrostomum lignano]